MNEYIIVEKNKSEFQKVLNQWKNLYYFDIIYIYYSESTKLYHALIKRSEKKNEN